MAAGIARTFLDAIDPSLLPLGVAVVLLVAAFIWFTRAWSAVNTAREKGDADLRDDLQANNADLHARLEAVKAERDRANESRDKWRDRYYDEREARVGHPIARPAQEDPT